MFCPKCGSILLPKFDKKVMACSCGYTSKDKAIIHTVLKPDVEKKEGAIKEQESLPLTEAECSKCHHPHAYWWTKQTRAGDEPETRFFKCEQCKHTWREYK
ncbi:transcription factor S [Candidatus Woesearchaeota archaeon]|nr:transcription factor S [Candidatus Woesearchaeota archaeon]